jgi:hypothetical protein
MKSGTQSRVFGNTGAALYNDTKHRFPLRCLVLDQWSRSRGVGARPAGGCANPAPMKQDSVFGLMQRHLAMRWPAHAAGPHAVRAPSRTG